MDIGNGNKTHTYIKHKTGHEMSGGTKRKNSTDKRKTGKGTIDE